MARDDATAESDADFLVDLPPEASLLDLGHFQMDLQEMLGCRVDVVEPEGLHPMIRERVLAEAMPL
jgi:uncharacterized protein